MEDDLSKSKIKRMENPKDIADSIAAIQVKYSCTIDENWKVVIIMHAGKAHYASILTATSNLIQETKNCELTPKEILD